MYTAPRLERSGAMNSVPFRENDIKRNSRVSFGLLYILLGTFIVLEKKELIGSFSLSLNLVFYCVVQFSFK